MPKPMSAIEAGSGEKVVFFWITVAVGCTVTRGDGDFVSAVVGTVPTGVVPDGCTVGGEVTVSAINVTVLFPLVTVPIAVVPL
jgi:hypothetical protein